MIRGERLLHKMKRPDEIFLANVLLGNGKYINFPFILLPGV